LDPLCDEGNAYADKLQQAGVEVEHKCWQGQPHSLMQFSNVLDAGQALMTEITTSLITTFQGTDP